MAFVLRGLLEHRFLHADPNMANYAFLEDGRLIVRLSAPPVDGKANAALLAFLAAEFGVGQRQVRILSGEKTRLKRILIQAPTRLPALPTG